MKNNDRYYDFPCGESFLGAFVGLAFLVGLFYAAFNKGILMIPKFADEKTTMSEIFSQTNTVETHLLASPVVLETYEIGVSPLSFDMRLPVCNIPKAHYDSETKTFYHEYNGNRF